MFYLIERGNANEIQMILQQGNDLVHMKNGFQERTALHKAAEYGDPVICQMLIQFGADVDIKDAKQKPPLWFAAKNGNSDICRLLINEGAEIYCMDQSNTTLLDSVSSDMRDLLLNWKDLHGMKFQFVKIFIDFVSDKSCLNSASDSIKSTKILSFKK